MVLKVRLECPASPTACPWIPIHHPDANNCAEPDPTLQEIGVLRHPAPWVVGPGFWAGPNPKKKNLEMDAVSHPIGLNRRGNRALACVLQRCGAIFRY